MTSIKDLKSYTDIDHVLQRSDMYIGSIKNCKETRWIIQNKEWLFIQAAKLKQHGVNTILLVDNYDDFYLQFSKVGRGVHNGAEEITFALVSPTSIAALSPDRGDFGMDRRQRLRIERDDPACPSLVTEVIGDGLDPVQAGNRHRHDLHRKKARRRTSMLRRGPVGGQLGSRSPACGTRQAPVCSESWFLNNRTSSTPMSGK